MRLIFLPGGHTILVAQTSFGKSLIFQAYSLLTGKITLEVIPLDIIGSQHKRDISNIPGLRPCFLSYATKQQDRSLLRRIQDLEFTNILLGPEQLTSPDFHKLLRDNRLSSKIGLLAIDEAHCIRMWSAFRAQYMQIWRAVRILPKDIVLFACTATMNKETENAIIRDGGFNEFRDWNRDEGIIRTSIDRTNAAIILKRVNTRNKIECLYFLLNEVFTTGELPPIQRIPKTLIFVNTKKRAAEVKIDLRKRLQQLGYSLESALHTIQSYTGDTVQFDRDRLMDIFEKPDSPLRIVVGTKALSMGANILDLSRVVQFEAIVAKDMIRQGDLPTENEVLDIAADLWQRFGRVARKAGMSGVAFMFLEAQLPSTIDGPSRRTPISRRGTPTSALVSSRQNTPNQRANRLTRDARTTIHSNPTGYGFEFNTDHDTLTEDPVPSIEVEDSSIHDQRIEIIRSLRNSEFKWMDFTTSGCLRAYILGILQQSLCHPEQIGELPPPSICCNVCNPSYLQDAGIDIDRIHYCADDVGSSIQTRELIPGLLEWATAEIKLDFNNTILSMNPIPNILLPPPKQLELAALLHPEMLMRTFLNTPPETSLSSYLCTKVKEFGEQMQWNTRRINSLLKFLLTYTLPEKRRITARKNQFSGAQYAVSRFPTTPESVAGRRARNQPSRVAIDKQVSISLAETLVKNGVVPIRRLPHPLSRLTTVSTP
jgi:Helicase conserved C-terminal domain/DEAD/DEAH box helicase